MKRIFIFAFILSVCVTLPAYAGSQFYNPIGKGCTNAFYIDKDCDGYGVASPLGVDADDNDPEVNTPETVIAKYGTLENFLHHLGYYPERIFYISANGDDSTGEVDNINKPYKTWDAVESQLQPGDAVIFRGGVYDYIIQCSKLNGTANKPIIVMAYPGEKAIIDAAYSITGFPYSYMIFDGFICDNTGSSAGWGHGIEVLDGSHHLSFKNIEVKHYSCGIKPMAGIHDILVENCVVHDNPHSHGMYFGSREVPNSNLTVRNCIMYRNGRHGFQHNGRVTNLILENNIIHSNDMGGISLLEGVSDSVIRNNLIFNNNRQGVVFFLYDDANPAILPYDQTNNLIVNNLIWIGKYKWDGSGASTSDMPAIHFNDATEAQNHSMDGNIFRNNILIAYSGPVFRFDQKKFADTTTIENNVIYRVGGSDEVMTYGEEDVYDFDAFQNFTKLIKRNVFQDPKLSNISVDYYSNPEKFNFDYLSNSSVRDFGTPVDAPSTDLRDNSRIGNVDAGCYEYGWISANKPPVANAGNDIIVVDMDDDWKENITLNASQSYDPDGQITHYLWTDTTGEELGRGKIITISLEVGIHTITLKVIDNNGSLSYNQIKVTVKEGPNVIRLKNGYEGYTGNSVITLWEGKPEGSDYCREIAYLGKYSGINRLVIRFDNLTSLLSSVSKNNSIVTAKLRLYNYENNANNHKINIYALKKPFEPQEVCWNNSSSNTPWAEPGAYNENDIEMTPISNITLDDKNSIWREWDVTSYVKEIRNGTRQNYGWLLNQENESEGYSFYIPEEDSSTALRPELVIHFQSPIQ